MAIRTYFTGATVFGLNLNLLGDGVSTVFKYDLQHPPFNLNFNGLTPQSMYAKALSGFSGTITATLSGSVMTLTFSAAPAAASNPFDGPVTLIQIYFFYDSQ